MRMAEPLVVPSQGASAPVIYFKKQYGATKMQARFVEATSADPMVNRVNLRPNAVYEVTLVMPPDYEQRRLELLQTKEQQLKSAVQAGETKLREHTELEARLLSHAARAQLIEDSADLRVQIDQAKVLAVSATMDAQRRDADLKAEQLTALAQSKEELLRQDDAVRDTLLPPPVVESLINQIRDLRTDLAGVQGSILSLQLMTANTTEPYTRIINGVVETFDRTPFTQAGTIPLSIDDEYLDWIREGKVVTIVSYDPNELPADDEAAVYRAMLPEQWPESGLLVIERAPLVAGVPRLASGGTAPNAQIIENRYPSVVARTYRDPANGMRTYLATPDGNHVWVFGPDVTPPANVEVWATGMAATPIKLYPPNERTLPEQAYVRQIAGVEGGAFDPVREAEKRGQVVAITRIGNLHKPSDDAKVRKAHGVGPAY
jgi:hypothetical protein